MILTEAKKRAQREFDDTLACTGLASRTCARTSSGIPR